MPKQIRKTLKAPQNTGPRGKQAPKLSTPPALPNAKKPSKFRRDLIAGAKAFGYM